MAYENILFSSEAGIARLTLNRPERHEQLQRRHACRSARRARSGRRRCVAAGAAAHRRRPRLLRRTGPGRSDRGARARSRSIWAPPSTATTGRWCSRCAACRCRWCARSTAWPPARARTLRSPATSSSPRSRRASFRRSPRSASSPTRAGPISCPAWSAPPAPWGWRCSASDSFAEQAAEWGLIWQCVEDAELAGTVEKLLRTLAGAPTAGLAATKRALYAAAGNSLEAQLDLERDLQRALGRSDDYREGVAAFTAKRAPRFGGR